MVFQSITGHFVLHVGEYQEFVIGLKIGTFYVTKIVFHCSHSYSLSPYTLDILP